MFVRLASREIQPMAKMFWMGAELLFSVNVVLGCTPQTSAAGAANHRSGNAPLPRDLVKRGSADNAELFRATHICRPVA